MTNKEPIRTVVHGKELLFEQTLHFAATSVTVTSSSRSELERTIEELRCLASDKE